MGRGVGSRHLGSGDRRAPAPRMKRVRPFSVGFWGPDKGPSTVQLDGGGARGPALGPHQWAIRGRKGRATFGLRRGATSVRPCPLLMICGFKWLRQ